jgi:hypothetical protein
MSEEYAIEEIKRLRAEAEERLTKASRLEAGLQQVGGSVEPPSAPAISPHTKLPVEDPESQAVERILYETGRSLCAAKVAEAPPPSLPPEKPTE